ncbi:MAG: cytochrome c-type biogenesis protein CcmH [Rhodomicrobium sp.]|nr:cytochrome c-type biogenesis protein CcmH [Rhodomicrobium sp.]
MLRDPSLEARARQLSQGLRCLVCQNQSIDDSNAPLAQDLRVLLRERIAAGDSDTQAVAFLVSRYGNFVLLKPPVQANTLFLWAGPVLILSIAALGFGWYLRAKKAPDAGEPDGFSESDEQRLDELLRKEKAI